MVPDAGRLALAPGPEAGIDPRTDLSPAERRRLALQADLEPVATRVPAP